MKAINQRASQATIWLIATAMTFPQAVKKA